MLTHAARVAAKLTGDARLEFLRNSARRLTGDARLEFLRPAPEMKMERAGQ